MIYTITLVILDISGILLITTYILIFAILPLNDWCYRFFKTFSSYRLFKKYIDESDLNKDKKEKCCLLYKIGIYSSYFYNISIFIIMLLVLLGIAP